LFRLIVEERCDLLNENKNYSVLVETPACIVMRTTASLLPMPHPRDLLSSHLLLQLENPIKQSLSGRRATGNIDVYGQDAVDATKNTVTVMVVAAPIGTAAHTDYPFGVWHLVVTQSNSRSHLVGDSAGNDHNVGLTRRGSKDDAQTVLVVSRHRAMHHLNAATCQGEGERPYGALSCPVGNLIE